ncbi:MAG: MFS transporter [Bacteroidales bacterium]|nr:MFS transporter [Bacteroidales bacterium]
MDTAVEKKYNYWQWRTLIILMVGYLLFYFVRKNFSLVMPALESELGLTKLQLGTFLTINGIVYGISRFTNGFLADRFSRKAIMAFGLALSAVVNIFIGLSPQLNGALNLLDGEGKATLGFAYFVGGLLIINGYMQGMGYPPCASLMANWFRPSELATKQSIWNSSHSIGAGLVALLCGFILQRYSYSAWQWCFFIPAALALAGAVLVFFGLEDTPESVGLPSPEELDGEKKVTVKDHKSYRKFIHLMVFRNPIIWILAATNFCVYVIRFTILDWGTTFMTQYKGMDIAVASSVVAASELFGGIVGTLVAGWATDKFFSSKAHRVCLICTLGATLSFFMFWKTPDSMNWLSIVFIVLSSFFVYGPQALLGIAASNQATKHAAASANGVLGIVGYVSPLVSGMLFGFLADSYGWDSVFAVAIGFGLLGAVVIASMWKAPADGYEKAHSLGREED